MCYNFMKTSSVDSASIINQKLAYGIGLIRNNLPLPDPTQTNS